LTAFFSTTSMTTVLSKVCRTAPCKTRQVPNRSCIDKDIDAGWIFNVIGGSTCGLSYTIFRIVGHPLESCRPSGQSLGNVFDIEYSWLVVGWLLGPIFRSWCYCSRCHRLLYRILTNKRCWIVVYNLNSIVCSDGIGFRKKSR
jgi:hypothetical protein